jgi:hypothetical protein
MKTPLFLYMLGSVVLFASLFDYGRYVQISRVLAGIGCVCFFLGSLIQW